MLSVGFQVAVLLPVIAVAVTTGETPKMVLGSLSTVVTVPVVTTVPAEYAMYVAAIAGPAVGVKAVEIALAIQPAPAAAARLSVTTISPTCAE